MSTTATIDQLRSGADYPDGNINARLHYTDAEIEELAASLKGPDGQLRPLLVATHPKKPSVFFVFGGGRRRIAFERLISRGDLTKQHAIEIKDHGHVAVGAALSMSFADNQAVPMHPADQAVTFAKLAADRSPEAIAQERGMTVKAVNQFIALGTTLADEILNDWRSGALTREVIETFTTAESKEAQIEALAWAKDQWGWKHNKHIDVAELRKKIMKNKEPVMKRLLGFVGPETYRGAGGALTEDFFGGGGVVHDMKLLNKMANTKMAALVDAQLADGWAWAEAKLTSVTVHHGFGELKVKPKFDAGERKRLAEIEKRLTAIDEGEPENEGYDEIERLESEKEAIDGAARLRAFTAKDKAKAGVLISLTSEGAVHYAPGLIKRPETKKKAGPTYSKPAEEPLNWSVRQKLSRWRDQAGAEALAEHPKEAMALFLASCGRGWQERGPIRTSSADRAVLASNKGKPLEAAYHHFRKLSADQLVAEMGAVAAACAAIDDREKDGFALIVAVAGADKVAAALAAKFDAKVYFSGASKQHMLGVAKEALGEEVRKTSEAKAVDALRKELIASVPKTGWLPPELRTARYDGPGAKAAAKKPAKTKKAKR